jgi:hypothetical protein
MELVETKLIKLLGDYNPYKAKVKMLPYNRRSIITEMESFCLNLDK